MNERDRYNFIVGLLLGNISSNSIAAFFAAINADIATLWIGFAVTAAICAGILFGMTAISRATGAA